MQLMLHRSHFIIFAVLLFTGCEDKPLSQTTVEFEGVQFPVPKDWYNVKPDKDQVKAQINHTVKMKSGDPTNKVDQLIFVEVGGQGLPKLPSAETVAKGQGGVNAQEFLLDGVNAIRFELPNKNRLMASAYHDGKAYVVIGSANYNYPDLVTTFNGVLQSWKWTK